MFSIWVATTEELCPCSPNEYDASNCCIKDKYDATKVGVFKSTPNKLIIHSWLVAITDSRI